MAQIFHRSTNTFSRVTIFGGLFIAGGVLFLLAQLYRSPYITNEGLVRPQPVQFSHEHHVKDDGIDCRYCHTTVEFSSFAGIPPTETCMNCHSQIWANSPALAPVFESWETGEPIRWTRVHDVPDFVYFNHSVHIQAGVGCASCHGEVDEMALMWKAEPMTMEWCLDCHRDPTRHLRPREEVFNMNYEFPANQAELGRQLAEQYGVPLPDSNGIQPLTDCYACHR